MSVHVLEKRPAKKAVKKPNALAGATGFTTDKQQHNNINYITNKDIYANDGEIPAWILKCQNNKGEVYYKIVTQVLANHIRVNAEYIFVRNNANNSVIRYWYRDGLYQQITDDELKGLIKEYIPISLQKINDINEVFNLLITDLNFVHVDKLNSDENIINFQNGLLYLDSMELKPHTPELYSTIQIPCNYNPNAKPSENKYFDNFINHLTENNEDVKSTLLQFIGVILSNIKGWRMKKALFMVGDGDVGKSQLKELTHKLLGLNNCSGIDLTKLEKPFGSSTIYNKRLIGSSDMSYATVTELKTFKAITGGDTISAEFKGKNSFEFTYNGLVWFCCNKLPKFGGDRGDWVYNRMILCECNNPVPKKDKYLQDKMFSEREYIVSLALKELQKVIDNDYEFVIAGSMENRISKYKVENDSLLQFIDEYMITRPVGKMDNCTKAIFYNVYKEWCKDNNGGYAESKKDVKATLEKLGLGDIKKSNGNYYYEKFTLSLEAKTEYKNVYGFDAV